MTDKQAPASAVPPTFPRGYVVTSEWLWAWDRCDPGDGMRNVGVHFVPHKEHQLPLLTGVMSVAEHTAALDSAKAEAEKYRALYETLKEERK